MQDLTKALDQFPAVQLRDTALVVKRLIVWSEEKLEDGSLLTSIPMSKLVDVGLKPSQIRAALDVFRKIHLEKHGGPTNGGIAQQPLPAPTISRGELRGVWWISLKSLDEELSKRENVSPSSRTALCYSLKDGIYLLDSTGRPCPLTKKQFDVLGYIHTKGSARLKEIARELKTTQSNASRDVREINLRFSAALGGTNLIQNARVVGYYVDDAKFSLARA